MMLSISRLKIKRILLGLFLISMSLVVVENASAEMETSISFNNGYRADELDWNIAGDTEGRNPNVLSELTWEDLKIYQVKTEGDILLNWFFMRASFGYGWILSGKNQDSDFSGDNRTEEFSRSNNNSSNGNVFDGSIGAGYQFKPGTKRFRITPLVGYSVNEQNLSLTDGFQTIPSTGAFENLDSTYDTKWKGPWVGVDLSVEATAAITLFGSVEYHWADYEAEANWNLRDDLAHPVSFKHSADGNGLVVSAGGTFALNKHWFVNANVNFIDWSTDPGTDQTFTVSETVTDDDTTDDDTTDDTTDTTTTTTSTDSAFSSLNEVNWNSFSIMLGVTYRF